MEVRNDSVLITAGAPIHLVYHYFDKICIQNFANIDWIIEYPGFSLDI